MTYSPPYLHEAELLFGLQAHAIATTAHDINGRFMPVYFQMPPLGDKTWWHPVLAYFTVPFLWVLPLTEGVVRLPSVVIGALNGVLVYFVGRRLWPNSRLPLLAGLLLIVTPAHFIHSRLAMDYIYPVPFVLGWLWCLLKCVERPRPGLLFAGGSLLGLGVYSYIASIVMMPLYVAATLLVLACVDRRPLKSSAVTLAGFVWPLIPLVVWLARHPDVVQATLHRYPGPAQDLGTQGLVSLLATKLTVYAQFFNPMFLFVWGGYASPVNSTPHAGVFPLTFLVLVPLGVWRAVVTRDLPSRLVVAAFVTAPVAAVLAVSEPWAIDREMELVPFGVFLAVEGYRWLRASRPRWRQQVATLLLAGTALHFAAFMTDYYTDYRQRSSFWFGLNKRGASEAAIASDAARPAPAVYLSIFKDPYIESYFRFAAIKHGRPDLIEKIRILPTEAIDLGSSPPGSIFIVNQGDVALPGLLADPALATKTDIPEIGEGQQFWVLRRR